MALILARSSGESILIGDAVRVTVLGMKGGCVRLSIQAPEQIKILRSEVHEEDKRRGQRRPKDHK